jgi:hypothetical protein
MRHPLIAKRQICGAFLSGLVLVMAWNHADAQTLEVGPGRQFTSIQTAVNQLPRSDGAAAGYTVLVYPGTYPEAVRLPNGLSGTATRPIVIRALLPARPPLDGSTWADQTSERSVIATPTNWGIYSGPTESVRFLEINGFYFTGGTHGAIYLEEQDSDIWVRNNVAVNVGNSAGENEGGFVFLVVARLLVQNNYWELSSSGGVSSRNAFNHKGTQGVYEYNECALLSGIAGRGRCLYFHSSSAGTIVRYNYLRLRNLCPDNLCWRMRDSINQQVHNNYVHSTAAVPHTWIHENTDAGLVENHVIQRNTWLYENGTDDDFPVLGMSFLNNTTVSRNMFVSGVADSDSYSVGRGYTQGSHSLILSDNVWWNYAAFKDPSIGPAEERGTIHANPQITTSGCSSAIDNNLYGANLNVSTIPYRRCDGALFPIATKWTSSPPPPPPPPPLPAPTNLRIIQ